MIELPESLAHRPIRAAHINRRGFLTVVSITAAAGLAAACSSKSSAPTSTAVPQVTDRLRWANWPATIDRPPSGEGPPPSLDRFSGETGIVVDYREVINDMDSFVASIAPQLAAGLETGWDLIVLDSVQTPQFIEQGWAEVIDVGAVPVARANLLPEFTGRTWDPENTYHYPYESPTWSIGWNTRFVDRELTSLDDLLDDRLRGHVGLYNGMEYTIGTYSLLLRSRGELANTPDKLTPDDARKVIDFLAPYVERGHFRFTGVDYYQGIISGDLWATTMASGDPHALGSPDIQFAYASEGACSFSDNLVIPKGSANKAGAEQLIDFWYQPENAALLTEAIQYRSPVKGVDQVVAQRNPELAANPWVFPPPDVTSRLHPLPAWNPDDRTQIGRMWEQLLGR